MKKYFAAVVLDSLIYRSQDQTLSQLAARFKVHPLVISKWKAQRSLGILYFA